MSAMDSPGTPPEGPGTGGAAPAVIPGMEVVDVAGVPLGTVETGRDAAVHLSREMERDVYLPCGTSPALRVTASG